MLYPVPAPSAPSQGRAEGPATVHYHYAGESLMPTGLDYATWLEWLLRARGAYYWLQLTAGPPSRRTWVDDNLDAMAALFPSFDPASMRPTGWREPIAV